MHTLADIEFHLPPDRIAHSPVHPRDHSRLLRLKRDSGEITHHHFYSLLDLLTDQDVIVRNNTKVMPARIFGQKVTSGSSPAVRQASLGGSSPAVRQASLGGKCELLLVRQLAISASTTTWECLTKPGLKLGHVIHFPSSNMIATCTEITEYTRKMEFSFSVNDFFTEIEKIGLTPIPPYIKWSSGDEAALRQLYQTTYAKVMGSVAAPTAGLHFTPELDEKLRNKGVQIEEVTLHVGLGTFLPLQDSQLQAGKLHPESYSVRPEVAQRLNSAKNAGKKILSVGTTTTRVLETCANERGLISPGEGQTELFIQPGDRFRFVDKLITNFHLPKSSLLFLVSAFVSRPNTDQEFHSFIDSSVGKAYLEAIQHEYRFYSFGDAMLIETNIAVPASLAQPT